MSTLRDLLLLPVLLWPAAWRLLGDRNGWLALVNAWAWWLLSAGLSVGMAALWRRSRLAALAWGIGVVALWLEEYRWMLPARRPIPGISQTDTGNFRQLLGDSRNQAEQLLADDLSLLTFNLLNRERALTPLLKLVARERPDVLLFQECIPSHAAQLESSLASSYPYRLWLPAAEYGMGFGIASRHPFALTGFWQYPGFEPFAARVTLSLPPVLPSSLLDLYCVQFISPTNEVRRVGLTPLLRLREEQIGWVLGEIDRRQQPALVAGDWNTTEGSDAYRRATAQLVDGWREMGNGPGWSWPRRLNPYLDKAVLPLLRLDYALHTGSRFAPGLAVAQMRVLRDDLGSDHCPLLAGLVVGDGETLPNSE